MPDFFEEYARVLRTALETGVQNVPILEPEQRYFTDLKHQRRFFSECHRGFEKAQNRIVRLLRDISGDQTLSLYEKEIRQLLLRKVIDSIAISMLQKKPYIMRRLALHDDVPNISFGVIQEALKSASNLNNESRQTFALVADLTTFIHVADIVRVDFRDLQPTVSFIELKSGRINKMLLDRIDKYEPKRESLMLIEDDPLIEKKYESQAKRMLRQRIRLAQIDEVTRTDKGTDIKFERPIMLSKQQLIEESYAPLIDQLCDEAKTKGIAAGVANYCIHIGVGFAAEREEARRNATDAVKYSIRQHLIEPPEGFVDIFKEVSSKVPPEDLFRIISIFHSNLHSVPCQPLVLWRISRDNLMQIIREKMSVLVAFDVSSFIMLARQLGLEMTLSSRKEATRNAQELGSANVPRWGNRGLKYKFHSRGEAFILSGFLSRFTNDLLSPASFLKQIHDTGAFNIEH